MIRLLVADDHAIVRSGLLQLFALTLDIQIAGEADHGDRVLERLAIGDIDLLLLDMSMPGISGVELILQIREKFDDLPILVLSMYNEPQIASRALRAGANGYLTKDCDPVTLLTAIRKVAEGGRHVDGALAEQIVFESIEQERPPHLVLSHRELEVLHLLAAGMAVNEIAERLILSNKTVSTHKLHMMEKMGFSSIADVVRYAIQHNFSD